MMQLHKKSQSHGTHWSLVKTATVEDVTFSSSILSSIIPTK